MSARDKSRPAKLRRMFGWGAAIGLLFAATFVGTAIRTLGWNKFHRAIADGHVIEVIAGAVAFFVTGILLAFICEWGGWWGD